MLTPFFIIFVSVAVNCLNEFVAWYLVYQTPKYKTTKKQFESLVEKLNEKKEAGAADKQEKKKLAQLEKLVKEKTQQMTAMKFKSTIFTMLLFICTTYSLNSRFSGVVVGRIPFTPLSFIQGISHRNLEGTDFQDCSSIFCYILCGMAFKANLSKLLGNEPKVQAPSMWPSYEPPAEAK